jgi:hypothetical protein
VTIPITNNSVSLFMVFGPGSVFGRELPGV